MERTSRHGGVAQIAREYLAPDSTVWFSFDKRLENSLWRLDIHINHLGDHRSFTDGTDGKDQGWSGEQIALNNTTQH
jgi:hypothetical protein